MLRGLSANKETGLLFLSYLRAMDLPATKKVATQQIRKYTPYRENVQAFIFLDKKWRVQTMKKISFSRNVAVLHLSSISDKSSLFKMSKTWVIRWLSFVSYWATLTLCNSEKFEFQRRVNKTICKSPVRTRLYKQVEKRSDLRRIVSARSFSSKITTKKKTLYFLVYYRLKLNA